MDRSRDTAVRGDTSKGMLPQSIFSNRGFLLLWSAYGVSALGDHLSEMALLKTQDAMHAPNLTQLLAKITFVFMLPFFVLGPFSGVLSDRLPRRALMIFADLVRAMLMLSFPWMIARFQGWGPWGAFLPLGVVGILAAIFSPARSALLPTLIRPQQLIQANAMISGLGVVATMISTALGGYLAQHYHPAIAFRLDALSFVGSAALLALIRVPQGTAHGAARGASHSGGLRAGFGYIARHHRVMELIAVAVLIWSVGAIVRSVIPAVVRDVYGRHQYAEMSYFQAFLGFGILSGSLILTGLADALRCEVAITWSLMGIGGAIGLLALSVFGGFAPSTAMILGALAITLAGMFAAGVMASYNALMQRIVPDYVRGRVFGVTDLCTIAGLLAVTGALGIPHWPQLDRWVGFLLAAVALVAFAAGVLTLMVRLRRTGLPLALAFWRNVNEFYCRWWFRLRCDGPCTIPRLGPAIVVANHTCTIDPLLLIACSRHRSIGFLIAREFYELPVIHRFVRMVGCIPVNRDGSDVAATRIALSRLRRGEVLGVFPQGRIERVGQSVPPKHGAAVLALHTRAPVIPAHISGARHRAGAAWPFFHRHYARVRFGDPVDLSVWYGRQRDEGAAEQATAQIMRAIESMAPRP
mgnify:CR=1 FL=1